MYLLKEFLKEFLEFFLKFSHKQTPQKVIFYRL